MTQIVLNRLEENDYQTIGELIVYTKNEEVFRCKTLELPWKNNQQDVSRIPANHYEAVKRESPQFGMSLWIRNVPNRTWILIHRGNYFKDTLGCILVGDSFYDIDGDGHLDVRNSASTMTKLLLACDDEIYINIFDPT